MFLKIIFLFILLFVFSVSNIMAVETLWEYKPDTDKLTTVQATGTRLEGDEDNNFGAKNVIPYYKTSGDTYTYKPATVEPVTSGIKIDETFYSETEVAIDTGDGFWYADGLFYDTQIYLRLKTPSYYAGDTSGTSIILIDNITDTTYIDTITLYFYYAGVIIGTFNPGVDTYTVDSDSEVLINIYKVGDSVASTVSDTLITSDTISAAGWYNIDVTSYVNSNTTNYFLITSNETNTIIISSDSTSLAPYIDIDSSVDIFDTHFYPTVYNIAGFDYRSCTAGVTTCTTVAYQTLDSGGDTAGFWIFYADSPVMACKSLTLQYGTAYYTKVTGEYPGRYLIPRSLEGPTDTAITVYYEFFERYIKFD